MYSYSYLTGKRLAEITVIHAFVYSIVKLASDMHDVNTCMGVDISILHMHILPHSYNKPAFFSIPLHAWVTWLYS